VRAIWAPEIHYIKRLNNYFITTSMPPGNRGILKSTTGKPEGPYVNALANDGFFHGGIDGTLFEDEDGKIYFTSGGASSILEMNDDLSATVGEVHHPQFEKPADGSWNHGSIAQEGASLFKRNGIYYLGGAAFYQGRYSSVVAQSTNIFGPYKNWQEAVPCGGGTDYFQDKNGNWFDAYFGNDNQSPFREKPAIVKIDFADDGKIFVAKDQPDFVLQMPAPEILTPPAPKTPRINGLKIFGVRPGAPFLYTIPATGERPIKFSAKKLPHGLKLDSKTGQITGSLKTKGEFNVVLRAKNSLSVAEKNFRIVVGNQIALTPAMGWNSWNCWAGAVDSEKVLRSAHALVASGLAQHGWTYINIDDTWQGARGGKFNAIQPNEKFPDMKNLCAEIHALGLKAGIYSTPWVRSYAGHVGGSAENPEGTFDHAPTKSPRNKNVLPYAVGKFSFATNDAAQFAAWGFDYLKYDWNPVELPQVVEMANALRATGRDIILSLSNNSRDRLLDRISEIAPFAQSWRTTGDINDSWRSLSGIGFSQAPWTTFSGPGHWNDPDMLIVGWVGWGPKLHPTKLTPDEQYTHISLWCLLSAPLLIGCDLEKLDAFTLNLLSNDEVLAIDQDSLGKQATCVSSNELSRVYEKDLDDGSKAVGLFNLGENSTNVMANWNDLKISGAQTVHDLWRQRDLGRFENEFSADVASHGVVFVRIFPAK
jgi:alpha-galactosidase